MLACIEPAQTSIEWALQESLCPDWQTIHDELEVDVDPDAVPDLLRTLGLPPG
ncbi:hypothetical protein MWU57_15500 [Isoptericola sp. S6320L]|uniref:hypothetical protein n=1 Tax=Isoptericola sp. S6320L TaxID=2926411 RepID=UPI001FF1C25A|nr:hypothetical protein [Isoptericola sp. S6320L]MCK0118438.1 hypothetical protein [Isoptericola sp. S6320L]